MIYLSRAIWISIRWKDKDSVTQINNLIISIEIFRYRLFRLFHITRYMIRRILLQNSLFPYNYIATFLFTILLFYFPLISLP